MNNAKTQQHWRSWVLPMVVGFLSAWLVVAFVSVPAAHSLTWPRLFSRSAWLMALAAGCALCMIWGICRVFREELGGPTASLRAYAWSAAIWLPLLTLVWNEHAVWLMLAPLPIAAILTHFFRRQHLAASAWEQDDMPSLPVRELFDSLRKLRRTPPAREAMLLAALILGTIAAVAGGRDTTAISLMIVLTAATVWFFTTRAPANVGVTGHIGTRGRRAAVLPCFLLTCLALTPFLRMGLGSSRVSSVVLAGVRQTIQPPRIQSIFRGYRGIVLLAPPMPKQKLVNITPKTIAAMSQTMRPTQPLVIAFDGAYHYFEVRPVSGATGIRTQRGDPIKANVHSADQSPLTMEAVQPLVNRVDAACCSAMHVALTNADTRLGRVDVELILRNRLANGHTLERSLGRVPVVSSLQSPISIYRPAVREDLRFSMKNASDMAFNEVVVKFHLATQRNLSGAKMQLRQFELVP
ncbi:hypothetical protein [Terriglobus sp. RCC_193]|uniref:hypothetical protein n=1 Tax=Terriglobus sp. RCC_193 TaxID=3239218 RepID=UPI003524AAF8